MTLPTDPRPTDPQRPALPEAGPPSLMEVQERLGLFQDLPLPVETESEPQPLSFI